MWLLTKLSFNLSPKPNLDRLGSVSLFCEVDFPHAIVPKLSELAWISQYLLTVQSSASGMLLQE